MGKHKKISSISDKCSYPKPCVLVKVAVVEDDTVTTLLVAHVVACGVTVYRHSCKALGHATHTPEK